MARGFLGYPSTIMLDIVVCALVLVVPVLLFSIYVGKFRHQYVLHRVLQSGLGLVLFVTVCLFEVDMRLHGGWQAILKNRPVELTADQMTLVSRILMIHLVFAISAVGLWTATLWLGWRRFANPPKPGAHSRQHKVLGWLSTISLSLTSVTGLVFYYYAFMV